MKPPLTVEAKVAEELRTWLASELEQLEASNTNQFAHHVVTILLHEDLAIEDEPLTAGDDFLKDIYSIKQGKTKDNQKKAAVQFLRDAVCCEVQVKEIQGVVDELMVRIDKMKTKMNNKRDNRRSLLAPIVVNVDPPVRHAGLKSDSSEEERYNEAFPSLSGEDSPCRDGPSCPNSSVSVWHSSQQPGGKENKEHIVLPQHHQQQRRTKSPLRFINVPCHSSSIEAQTCLVARKAAALALGEAGLALPEATEVPRRLRHSSHPLKHNQDQLSCWRSAFTPISLTVLFKPSTSPLWCPQDIDKTKQFKFFSPFKLEQDYSTQTAIITQKSRQLNLIENMIGASDQPTLEQNSETDDTGLDEDDKEISHIYQLAKKQNEKSHSKGQSSQGKSSDQYVTGEKQINGRIKSFPDHHGDFWDKMIACGVISLYPKFCEEKGLDGDTHLTGFGWFETKDNAQSVSRCSTATDNEDDSEFSEDDRTLEQPNHCTPELIWTDSTWDKIRKSFLACVNLYREELRRFLVLRHFWPSELSSCLSHEGDQLLQSAFVNSLFAVDTSSCGDITSLDLSLQRITDPAPHCNDVEHYLFSASLPNAQRDGLPDFVKGITCSQWLEDNCELGPLCPFSHPSI